MPRRRSHCVVEVRASTVVPELLYTRTVPSLFNVYLTLVWNQDSWSTLKAFQFWEVGRRHIWKVMGLTL